MNEYISSIWQEMQATINSGLTLDADVKVVQALKIERYDLRQLIADLDIYGDNGIKMPLIVFRFYPAEPSDWGMHNESYEQRVEIYFIDRSENEVYTDIAEAANSINQKVSSTDKMFAGQILTFETAKTVRTIVSFPSAGTVSLDSAVLTVLGEKVSSELVTDVGVRIQQIKELFKPGTSFQTFQILEQGGLDLTDVNPVNSALMEKNVAMLAGSFYMTVVYGNAY